MIIIDIREESELLDTFLQTSDPQTIILNIPMKNIKFSIEGIKKLSEKEKIYLICQSSNRSNKIKDLYFKDNENIISVNGGIKNLNLPDITLEKGSGHYGFQQKMQITFALILFVVLMMVFFNVSKNILLSVIGVFILAIGLQIMTKSCLLSKILS